jgi:D-beta-D-heptose 7-phosphate kinase/D-beta-D-heptose 1-phosphate adenosyltransferase
VKNEIENIITFCRELLRKYHLGNLIVTRSELGVSLYNREGEQHFPTEGKEVYDVSGAGDTIVATLAFSLIQQLDLKDAIFLANIAAGFVVGKMGTYTISKKELLQNYQSRKQPPQINTKIVMKNKLGEMLADWKKAGDVIVFTNGCFDLIHCGHITYLEQAASLGDRLIIGLNSDRSVSMLKGKSRPYIQENDRAFVLAAFSFVDAVTIFDEETPEKLIQMIQPDYLVKGGDYRPNEIAGRHYAKEVKILPFIEGYSTTKIAASIQKGYEEDES